MGTKNSASSREIKKSNTKKIKGETKLQKLCTIAAALEARERFKGTQPYHAHGAAAPTTNHPQQCQTQTNKYRERYRNVLDSRVGVGIQYTIRIESLAGLNWLVVGSINK